MNIDVNELQKTLGEKELQILLLKSKVAQLQKELAEAQARPQPGVAREIKPVDDGDK